MEEEGHSFVSACMFVSPRASFLPRLRRRASCRMHRIFASPLSQRAKNGNDTHAYT